MWVLKFPLWSNKVYLFNAMQVEWLRNMSNQVMHHFWTGEALQYSMSCCEINFKQTGELGFVIRTYLSCSFLKGYSLGLEKKLSGPSNQGVGDRGWMRLNLDSCPLDENENSNLWIKIARIIKLRSLDACSWRNLRPCMKTCIQDAGSSVRKNAG